MFANATSGITAALFALSLLGAGCDQGAKNAVEAKPGDKAKAAEGDKAKQGDTKPVPAAAPMAKDIDSKPANIGDEPAKDDEVEEVPAKDGDEPSKDGDEPAKDNEDAGTEVNTKDGTPIKVGKDGKLELKGSQGM